MNFEKAVKEVQDRFETVTKDVTDTLETVGERSQGVAKVSLKHIKAANEIVISGVQDIVTAQTAAAKDLYSVSKQSFDKAVAAGLVAVVKAPVEYIPDGRDTLLGAFNETVETITKTGEKLVKVAKNSYTDLSLTIQGKPLRKPAARKTKAKATVSAAA